MTPVTALSSAAEASQLADTRPVASPTPHDREYHPAREQAKGTAPAASASPAASAGRLRCTRGDFHFLVHRHRGLHGGSRIGRYARSVTAARTLTADRVFDVFGDHSFRMDIRG